MTVQLESVVKSMNKKEYERKRAELVNERIRLMDLLESQEDFPDPEDVAKWEANKRAIIDLDCEWKFGNDRKEDYCLS